MSAEVLYRKYRPKKLNEILGQEHVTKVLESALKNKNFSHAYLFTGPRGTGKTSTARIFSRLINEIPENETAEIPDIVELDAASNRGIDEIRKLREDVNFLPIKYKKKIFIIDEVHMLTKEAFNALLKTLEEPPVHVVFILATTEVNKVPLTILSRVQRHDFRLAREEILKLKLLNILKNEGIEIDEKSLQVLWEFSGGSFRDAESNLEKLIYDKKQINFEKVKAIFRISDEKTAKKILEFLLSKNPDTKEILNIFKEEVQSIDFENLLNSLIRILRETIVENLLKNISNLENEFVALLGNLMEIKVKAKNSKDIQMLLELLIFKNIVKGNGSFTKIKIETSAENSLESNIRQKENDIVGINEIPPVKNLTEFEGIYQNNMELFLGLREIDGRLLKIIQASQIFINKADVTVIPKFKFHLKTLEENKNIILEELKKKSKNEINTLNIVEKLLISSPEIHRIEKVDKENRIIKVEKELEVEEDSVFDFDNTSLVEEILK